jgi:hypothetical protein
MIAAMAEIVTAEVFHARIRPKRNMFRYGVYYLRIPIQDLSAPATRGLFSVDHFNLFSLRSNDYAARGVNAAAWVRATLDDWRLQEANGEVQLLTMPRVLGYAFNPVSFWLCHDLQRNLRAVIVTVSNTFGEQHCYLCCHEDRSPIGTGDWLHAEKIFHVSPFLAVEGHYQFRFVSSADKVAIWINHYESGQLILSTSLIGRARPVNSRTLLFCFFRYPLVTLKVIALIHYQAAKLFLKGIRHFRKPAPPLSGVSR